MPRAQNRALCAIVNLYKMEYRLGCLRRTRFIMEMSQVVV
jgi:hypothetical protein